MRSPCGRPPGRRPPGPRRRPGRPLRRQRPVPHIGRRGRGRGPVPVHDPPRLRLSRRRRPPVGEPLEREGGQAQFIVHDRAPIPQGSELEALFTWLRENRARRTHPHRHRRVRRNQHPHPDRRFRDQTGTTPLRWLHRARVRQAQHLFETTSTPSSASATRSASPPPPHSATASNAPPASARRPTDARSPEPPTRRRHAPHAVDDLPALRSPTPTRAPSRRVLACAASGVSGRSRCADAMPFRCQRRGG